MVARATVSIAVRCTIYSRTSEMGLQIQKEGVAKGVNIDGMWEGKSLMQRMEKMKNAKRFKQKVSQSRLSRAHFGVKTSTWHSPVAARSYSVRSIRRHSRQTVAAINVSTAAERNGRLRADCI